MGTGLVWAVLFAAEDGREVLADDAKKANLSPWFVVRNEDSDPSNSEQIDTGAGNSGLNIGAFLDDF